MGYGTDQALESQLKSILGVQYKEDEHLAQVALDNAEIAREAEAEEKKKKKGIGTVLGIIGTVLLPGTASLWQLALGAAIGGQAGEWGYEQWEWFAGSKQDEMERTMDVIDNMEERMRFANLSKDLKEYNIAARKYNEYFTDEGGWDDLLDLGSDFLTYMSWGELLGLGPGAEAKTIWDVFKKKATSGVKSAAYKQGADWLDSYNYSYTQDRVNT